MATDSGLGDGVIVEPPSEAIFDSTRLVNDSVIVAVTTPGNGKLLGSSASTNQRTN